MLVSLFCDSNVWGDSYEWSHTHTHTHTHTHIHTHIHTRQLRCAHAHRGLILKIDWESCLSTASQHGSTAVAARISSSVSWLKLWDMALDHGPRGTAVLQALYRTLTKPSFGKSRCSICDMEDVASHFEHHVVKHTPIQIPERIVQCLLEESPEIFDHARHF